VVGGSEYGFGSAFIDIDEWRDVPRRHRYVHGGFEGTNTRFSFYLPPPELYRGRMFQHLSGGAGGDENFLLHSVALGFGWAFDLAFDDHGGYIVESNQGHFATEATLGTSGALHLFVASAESGTYSKEVAREMYGEAPHHSYIWGGSGGGLRSIACIENRPDVWDGDVSFVIGDTTAPSFYLAWAYWWLYCRDHRDEIIDAMEPGGSGDPFAALDHDQRYALAALYKSGYPRGATNQLWASSAWMFGMGGLRQTDPTYFEDFWSKPGYLGHDQPERLGRVLVDVTCTVSNVIVGVGGGIMAMVSNGAVPETGSSYAIEVDGDFAAHANTLYMARVTVLTGQAEGRQLYIASQDGSMLLSDRMTTPEAFDDVQPGDQVRIDNRDLIAFAHRWLYALELEDWFVDDPATGTRPLAPECGGVGFIAVDDKPVYPARPARMLPRAQTGQFNRKMIHIAAALDTAVPQVGVGMYHRSVCEHQGRDVDEMYRLWWVDNAPHGAAEVLLPWSTPEKNPGVWRSRLVGYEGVVRQGLVSIVEWVEEGTAPPPTTSYRYTSDGALALASTAAERGGVQPVVKAAANGALRAEVSVGEPVTFTGVAEQPPGAGAVVFARWDFYGAGDYSYEHAIETESTTVKVEVPHAFDEPGTYFASFRVGAHRDGLKGQVPIENLARVRVVVNPK
jgi:hypothetical protein